MSAELAARRLILIDRIVRLSSEKVAEAERALDEIETEIVANSSEALGRSLHAIRPTLRESDHVVQTACKLFNRDGRWPGWFLWMVTNNVPERFKKEAARIAVQKAKEDENLRGVLMAERTPAGNRQAIPRRRP